MDYAKCFDRKERVAGGNFYCLKDESPDYLTDFVYKVHNALDCGHSDDWIYEQIYYAFDELSENDIDDITIEADCYNSKLIEWLGNGYAIGMCNEAMEEFGSKDNIIDMISQGQWYTMDKIYHMVNDFLEERRLKNEE